MAPGVLPLRLPAGQERVEPIVAPRVQTVNANARIGHGPAFGVEDAAGDRLVLDQSHADFLAGLRTRRPTEAMAAGRGHDRPRFAAGPFAELVLRDVKAEPALRVGRPPGAGFAVGF